MTDSMEVYYERDNQAWSAYRNLQDAFGTPYRYLHEKITSLIISFCVAGFSTVFLGGVAVVLYVLGKWAGLVQ
jgi:hypothetical protein